MEVEPSVETVPEISAPEDAAAEDASADPEDVFSAESAAESAVAEPDDAAVSAAASVVFAELPAADDVCVVPDELPQPAATSAALRIPAITSDALLDLISFHSFFFRKLLFSFLSFCHFLFPQLIMPFRVLTPKALLC